MAEAPSTVHAFPGLDDGAVFRTLFSAYPDALLVVDGSGHIVLANPSAAELLGYGQAELVGLAVDVLVPDSIRPRHAAYRDAYAHKPRARPMGTQMELVAKRRDGSEVMVEIALSPLQEHGLPYVVAAIRGIGAYPRVRQALQRARYSEQVAVLGRLAVDTRDGRQLVQQVPRGAVDALEVERAAVYLLEADGLEWRVAACVGAGLVEGERVPQAADTLPGRLLAEPHALTVVHADGSTLAVPLFDRGRTVGALLVHSREPQRFGDEEQRFAEALASLLATSLQRTQTEEALQHAQRLESVGQLTGGIAHDFNNLLTIISGNLQVLEDLPAVAGDAHGQQLVAAASRATRRGAELTGKLLAFSRRQVLQPSAVDVGALLHSLADMLRRTLDQRIRIALALPAAGPRCMADPGQLESALLNIAINARDAMPEGGTLGFGAEVLAAPPAELRGELPAGSYVAIHVQDSGTGMTDAVKERAFEPFFTTKDSGRGTGLGLSTVYGFAKQSRGAVTLDSAPGVGTTVTLFIPSVVTPRASPPSETATVGTAPPRGLRVLLVEDDADVRAVAQQLLAELGWAVTPCATAEQALPLLAAGRYDLLASDIALGPGLRGTELARRAQAQQPGLRVLLMSGYSNELLDAAEATALPWQLLPKPYTRESLALALARALA